MKNFETIKEAYKPERGRPPVSPCENCKEKPLSELCACNRGFGICKACLDYHEKMMLYNREFVYNREFGA